MQPGEMLFEIVGWMRGEFKVGGFGEGFEIGVIGEDAGDLAVEFAVVEIVDELMEAVGFLADEEGDALVTALALEDDADFHVDAAAELEEAGDDFGEVGAEVLEIDEHVHDEEAADDALLDVFDVDAAFGDVGGELGNDAFLVFAEDADDCEDGLGHVDSIG